MRHSYAPGVGAMPYGGYGSQLYPQQSLYGSGYSGLYGSQYPGSGLYGSQYGRSSYGGYGSHYGGYGSNYGYNDLYGRQFGHRDYDHGYGHHGYHDHHYAPISNLPPAYTQTKQFKKEEKRGLRAAKKEDKRDRKLARKRGATTYAPVVAADDDYLGYRGARHSYPAGGMAAYPMNSGLQRSGILGIPYERSHPVIVSAAPYRSSFYEESIYNSGLQPRYSRLSYNPLQTSYGRSSYAPYGGYGGYSGNHFGL